MKSLEELKALWKEFGNVPVDAEDFIEQQFLHFQAGTPKEEVWHWFEEQNPEFIVGDMLYGKVKREMNVDRFWGVNKDKIAAKQLGVGDNWSIFVMANEIDYVDDMLSIAQQFNEYVSAEEVIVAIQDVTKRVLLPGKLQFVGMSPLGDLSKEIYGVVDFSECEDRQGLIYGRR